MSAYGASTLLGNWSEQRLAAGSAAPTATSESSIWKSQAEVDFAQTQTAIATGTGQRQNPLGAKGVRTAAMEKAMRAEAAALPAEEAEVSEWGTTASQLRETLPAGSKSLAAAATNPACLREAPVTFWGADVGRNPVFSTPVELRHVQGDD